MSTTKRSIEPLDPRLGLTAAIERAQQWGGPVRLVHDDGDVVAELYVNRGCVIHADVNGLCGVPAVAAMAGTEDLRFLVEPGRWPRRCSMLAPWDTLMRDVERMRMRAQTQMIRVDDEATTPLFEG